MIKKRGAIPQIYQKPLKRTLIANSNKSKSQSLKDNIMEGHTQYMNVCIYTVYCIHLVKKIEKWDEWITLLILKSFTRGTGSSWGESTCSAHPPSNNPPPHITLISDHPRLESFSPKYHRLWQRPNINKTQKEFRWWIDGLMDG